MGDQQARDDSFKRKLNRYLMMVTMVFGSSLGVIVYQFVKFNAPAIESVYWPAAKDYTFQNWAEDADGFWSADAYLFKARQECIYVKDQIETVVGVTPSGAQVEAVIEYVDDQTPGNNRNVGWQELDKRFKIRSLDFVPGTVFRGSVLHNCREGLPTVTFYGPFTVGRDTDFPLYVKAWIAGGRKGFPDDYR
jgi:hypothetical protein